MTFNEYFPAKSVINLRTRSDRWQECAQAIRQFNLTGIHRVDAYSHRDGTVGCFLSHRKAIERFLRSDAQRLLILEDDFVVLHTVFDAIWSYLYVGVPSDWDLLYLGGQVKSDSVAPVSEYWDRCYWVLMTHAYAITRAYATTLLYELSQPIDVSLSKLAIEHKHYICRPRLFGQSAGFSDIQRTQTDYLRYTI